MLLLVVVVSMLLLVVVVVVVVVVVIGLFSPLLVGEQSVDVDGVSFACFVCF